MLKSNVMERHGSRRDDCCDAGLQILVSLARGKWQKKFSTMAVAVRDHLRLVFDHLLKGLKLLKPVQLRRRQLSRFLHANRSTGLSGLIYARLTVKY